MREIGFLFSEIVHFKKRGRAFTGRRREDGRISQREPIVIKKIAHGFDDRVADFQNRVRFFRAQPQMPIVQKKFRAMFFRRDRKVVRILDDLCINDVDLDSAGRARVFTHTATHDER